ncbi:b65ea896-cc05-42a0-ac36-65c3002f8542 [Sclerotinia trifoliorum]|uniref:B65ea896-cc05-42a0-ac36-65c3002f8542 n=1 Tax=Sclerotinia trifoliorum TaxID=28548 RepID=A0A8H2VYA6_9HELO|nr:b65ea896-cc05-42a0-ac36-65c3002f8542 [Sclerotinia trifoliorum]
MDGKGLKVSVYKNWNVPCKGQWKVTTFPSKESCLPTSKSPTSTHPSSPTNAHHNEREPSQNFAFVNSSSQGTQADVNIRKFVRKHVRNDYLSKSRENKRRPKVRSTTIKDVVDPQSVVYTGGRQNDDIVIEGLIGFPTALSLSPWPIEMTPETHRLLSRYFTYASSKIYPLPKYLSSNPLCSAEWFRFTISDAVMFHAILYAAALYISLLQGGKESEVSVYHLGKVLENAKDKLQKGQIADDSTIAALSCVASGEAYTGHPDLWHIHMRGIQQMIKTRGTMSSLPIIIQAKLRRSDVTGAIDYAAEPYLYYEPRSHSEISISQILPAHMIHAVNTRIATIFAKCAIHSNLIEIMQHLAIFYQSIQFAASSKSLLEPREFLNDIYWIEYELLSFPSSAGIKQESGINKATRIGALLFMKSIIDEFPHSAIGPSILLQQLQDSLSTIDTAKVTEQSRQWLIWLFAIGAVYSKRERISRTWFVEQLAGLHMERLKDLLVDGQIHAEKTGEYEEEFQLWEILELKNVIEKKELLLLWDDVSRWRLKLYSLEGQIENSGTETP